MNQNGTHWRILHVYIHQYLHNFSVSISTIIFFPIEQCKVEMIFKLFVTDQCQILDVILKLPLLTGSSGQNEQIFVTRFH